MDIPGHHKLGLALRGHTTGRRLTSAAPRRSLVGWTFERHYSLQ